MKNPPGLYFYVIIFLCTGFTKAQSTETIRLKKDQSLIFFFQKGAKCDTLIKNKTDLFYLLVPDSFMESAAIFIENGYLQLNNNDSLVQLMYLKGLNYESLFERDKGETDKIKLQRKDLKSFINGASHGNDVEKNRIVVRIADRKSDKTILRNVFYYSN